MIAPSKTKKTTLRLLAISVLLASGLTAVHGQSALDGFDPNANGTVRAIVLQPDGKIILGGDFTQVTPNGGAPITRNRIARFNIDGTLDTTFNPNADGGISYLALQPDGKVLAGGQFLNVGGQARSRMARLDGTTGLADGFNPNANNIVFAIAVQPDGKILAAAISQTLVHRRGWASRGSMRRQG